MWRKLLFWLPEDDANSVSLTSSHADTEACREWTPFLTALFDGEADEDGALQARRHLLVCERCARAWMDWNQTRSLLINHSAPPPPPSLLWRIRLACRLGNPTPAKSAEPSAAPMPDMAAQILARTTRQNAKPAPAFGFASLLTPSRSLRTNAPLLGAFAMGAFVLFIARDSLLFSTPPTSIAVNTSATLKRIAKARSNARNAILPRANQAATSAKTPSVAPPAADENSGEESVEPRAFTVSRRTQRPGSSASLERARRERESLASSPVRLASFESSEPLPMLPAPRPIVFENKEPEPVRTPAPMKPPKLARWTRIAPRPVASAPQISSASVMLASFEETPAPASDAAPSSRTRRPGRSTTSPLPTAPLRISAPHASLIVLPPPTAPTSSDDDGLEELGSVVQDYRNTLSNDSSDLDTELG